MDLVKSSMSHPVTLPTQRTSRDPSDVKLYSLYLTQCLVTAAVILLSVLLLVVILSRARLRKDFFKQCLVSLATGGAIFSLLARPGAIHEETTSSILTDSYCGFYLTILDVESVVVPYTMIILTTERLVAISCPHTYAKRFTPTVKAILLALPWVSGLVYGLVRTFGLTDNIIAHYGAFPDDPYYNRHSELATGQCMLIFYKRDDFQRLILGDLVTPAIPVITLLTTNLALIIQYCRQQVATRGTPDLDLDLDRPVVHRGSVVFVFVINNTLIVALVSNFMFTIFVDHGGTSLWKICIVELVIAILALTILPDMRRSLNRMFCCHDNADDRDALIIVTSDREQTSDTGNQDHV